MSTQSGRKKVTDDDIICLFKDSEEMVLTAPEIAEHLPISKQQVNKRLKQLREMGILESKQCGSGQAWWIARQ